MTVLTQHLLHEYVTTFADSSEEVLHFFCHLEYMCTVAIYKYTSRSTRIAQSILEKA